MCIEPAPKTPLRLPRPLPPFVADTSRMGDHDTVLVRLRAALCADDPWTALYALHLLNTDRPGPLAGAVEELYRSDADQRAFRPYLSWLLRVSASRAARCCCGCWPRPVSLPTTARAS